MEIKLINETTNSELALSEESMNFILQLIDWGTVEANHNSVPYTDTIGEEVTETFFEPRNVSIIGWIVGNNQEQIAAKKDVLNKLINPKQSLKIIYKNYALKVKPNRTIKYGTRYNENNNRMCKFTLDFTAFQPLFLLKEETIRTITVITPQMNFPLVFMGAGIIFGKYQEYSIENMLNIGDVPAGFILTLTATGPVTNPILTNLDTGKKIKLNIDLVLNDVVTISTISGNKYIELIKDGVTSNILGKLTRDSVLFTLASGYNHFELSADANATNLEIGIEYVPRFLEVQD